MTDVRIRRLGPGDAAVLARLALDAADFDLEGSSGEDVPLGQARAEEYLADPGVLHWVADVDGTVVGELLCHRLPLPHGDGVELLLYAIGVRAAWRRRGVGSALVREMDAWLAAHDVRTVWVVADNPDAEAFYAAHGLRAADPEEQGTVMVRTRRPGGLGDT